MPRKSQDIRLLMTHADLGREAWIKWDGEACVYELFASDDGSDYIGCADTASEARQVAREWFQDLMTY